MLVVVGTTTVDVVLTGTNRLPLPGADEFAGDAFTLLDDPVRLHVGGNGAISPDSPLGRALIGHSEGDAVEVDAPRGRWTARILSVRRQ